MPKRVTETKLVAASRALLALIDCEDYDEVIDHHHDVTYGNDSPGGYDYHGSLDHATYALSSDQLVRLANLYSYLASPDIDGSN